MKEEVYILMKSHVGRSPMYPMRSPPRQTTALGAPKPSALQPPPEAGVASGWQWKKHEKTGNSFDLT